MLVLNAFSINMLREFPAHVQIKELDLDAVRELLAATGVESAIGHSDTAAVFSILLGREIPCNRTTVYLHLGQQAIVGQYIGPRLPEGATLLPKEI